MQNTSMNNTRSSHTHRQATPTTAKSNTWQKSVSAQRNGRKRKNEGTTLYKSNSGLGVSSNRFCF